jgi:hypothetical protein
LVFNEKIALTPAEAQKMMAQVKANPVSRRHLRVVGDVDNPDASGPGAKLQSVRHEQNLSIVQVAHALKLKPDQIAAIEAMQFGLLPGLGYALGYVRAYGEFLGIADVKSVVDDFRDTWAPQQVRHEENRHVLANKFALPLGVIAAVAVLGWISVNAFVQVSLPHGEANIERPDAAIKEWADKGSVSPSRPVVEIDPLTNIVAKRAVQITLRGEDGALVLSRNLRAGESISTDGLGRFIISTGDAGAIEIHGHGMVVVAGENSQPLSNWRSPDLVALANEKARLATEKSLETASNLPKAGASTGPTNEIGAIATSPAGNNQVVPSTATSPQ